MSFPVRRSLSAAFAPISLPIKRPQYLGTAAKRKKEKTRRKCEHYRHRLEKMGTAAKRVDQNAVALSCLVCVMHVYGVLRV